MKKYFFIAVVAFAAAIVFIGNSTDDELAQTRAINDKKEACLNKEAREEIDDDCRVIIREARGE